MGNGGRKQPNWKGGSISLGGPRDGPALARMVWKFSLWLGRFDWFYAARDEIIPVKEALRQLMQPVIGARGERPVCKQPWQSVYSGYRCADVDGDNCVLKSVWSRREIPLKETRT